MYSMRRNKKNEREDEDEDDEELEELMNLNWLRELRKEEETYDESIIHEINEEISNNNNNEKISVLVDDELVDVDDI